MGVVSGGRTWCVGTHYFCVLMFTTGRVWQRAYR